MGIGLMDRPLTEKERMLGQLLIPWLTDEMITQLSHQSPSPDTLYNRGQSNFENGTSALETVGVLEPIDNVTSRILRDERGNPIIPNQISRKDLDGLLEALAWHAGYVSGISKPYEILTPNGSSLKQVCAALVVCSYMEAVSENKFIWAERFSPWLISAGEWSFSDISPVPEIEVDAALDLVPSKMIPFLSDRDIGYPPTFLTCFFDHWVDQKWMEGHRWTQAPSDNWDMPLARGVYLRLQGDQND